MSLTVEQQKAHNQSLEWFVENRGTNNILRLGGYAGTGKTYTIGQISRTLSKLYNARIAYVALSGKASEVLKDKVAEFLNPNDFCGTLHKLNYKLVEVQRNRLGRDVPIFMRTNAASDYDLIVIDEASMVPKFIVEDIQRLKVPVLAVGDHAQLGPVEKKGEVKFNLMENPDIRLETIVRQVEGNPIIKMSFLAREYGSIPFGDYGNGCQKTRDLTFLQKHNYGDIDSMMLCASHKTRKNTINYARAILGKNSPYPMEGEPLICLATNYGKKIFNGNIGILNEIDLDYLDNETAFAIIDFSRTEFHGEIDLPQFNKKNLERRKADPESMTDKEIDKLQDICYFDWAYCITVWKAQGSEWKNVTLKEEYLGCQTADDKRRMLYTACTRAREKLVIVQ